MDTLIKKPALTAGEQEFDAHFRAILRNLFVRPIHNDTRPAHIPLNIRNDCVMLIEMFAIIIAEMKRAVVGLGRWIQNAPALITLEILSITMFHVVPPFQLNSTV